MLAAAALERSRAARRALRAMVPGLAGAAAELPRLSVAPPPPPPPPPPLAPSVPSNEGRSSAKAGSAAVDSENDDRVDAAVLKLGCDAVSTYASSYDDPAPNDGTPPSEELIEARDGSNTGADEAAKFGPLLSPWPLTSTGAERAAAEVGCESSPHTPMSGVSDLDLFFFFFFFFLEALATASIGSKSPAGCAAGTGAYTSGDRVAGVSLSFRDVICHPLDFCAAGASWIFFGWYLLTVLSSA
mmetsp:Transcript_950/g.3151  ORF Transcript_950/g.3151 Transcript_950/m.3151 type:complete len:243 (-) Transcript_950:621-1349(-)